MKKQINEIIKKSILISVKNDTEKRNRTLNELKSKKIYPELLIVEPFYKIIEKKYNCEIENDNRKFFNRMGCLNSHISAMEILTSDEDLNDEDYVSIFEDGFYLIENFDEEFSKIYSQLYEYDSNFDSLSLGSSLEIRVKDYLPKIKKIGQNLFKYEDTGKDVRFCYAHFIIYKMSTIRKILPHFKKYWLDNLEKRIDNKTILNYRNFIINDVILGRVSDLFNLYFIPNHLAIQFKLSDDYNEFKKDSSYRFSNNGWVGGVDKKSYNRTIKFLNETMI